MEKLPLSLIIITLDEEKNIERCIRSVPFAGDVLVLDSGSQDRTVDIARRLGARILQEAWRGFSKQKIRATALARYEWVLSLDADEALSPEAQKLIYEMVQGQKMTADAYSMPRLSYYLTRWMHHSAMYPDYQTRLFHRERAKWTETQVHEKVTAPNIERLSVQIFHWPFETISAQIETINRYSQLRVQDLVAKGERYSTLRMLTKVVTKFFETYIIKRGFLDGVEGVLVALVASFATFLRWAKLYEHELKQREKKP